MALREDLLPMVDELRAIAGELGFRPVTVAVRVRQYTGAIGAVSTTLVAQTDTPIEPTPKVRPSRNHRDDEVILDGAYADATGQPRALRFDIGPITPAYADGGYTAADLMPADDTDRRVTLVLSGGQHGAGEEYRVVRCDDSRPLRIMLTVERTRQGA